MNILLDVIALDVHDDRIDVCRWDGAALSLERWPATADAPRDDAFWHGRLAPLRPRPGFELLHRWRVEGAHAADAAPPDSRAQALHDPRALERAADSLGCAALRRVDDRAIIDPGVVAARTAADRLRLGPFIAVEMESARAAAWAVDRRGRTGPAIHCDHDGDPVAAALSLIDQVQAQCGAFAGPAHHAKLPIVPFGDAERAGADGLVDALCTAPAAHGQPASCSTGAPSLILFPAAAPALAPLGMLLSDRVLDFRADCTVSLDAFDAATLRTAFARLMDAAAAEITRLGADLDDAECLRFLELASPDSSDVRAVTCEAFATTQDILAALRTADRERVSSGESRPPLAVFPDSNDASTADRASPDDVGPSSLRLRSLLLRAVVQLPAPLRPRLDAATLDGLLHKAPWADPRGRVRAPDGWQATPTAFGDLFLEPAGQCL